MLADDEMCLATPAIAGDKLLIRTAETIYCLQRADHSDGDEEQASQ